MPSSPVERRNSLESKRACDAWADGVERMSAIVTLTTDFGAGEHIGAMNGPILTAGPEATVVGIDHSIRPPDPRHGASVLYAAGPHSPLAGAARLRRPRLGPTRPA